MGCGLESGGVRDRALECQLEFTGEITNGTKLKTRRAGGRRSILG